MFPFEEFAVFRDQAVRLEKGFGITAQNMNLFGKG